MICDNFTNKCGLIITLYALLKAILS